MDDPSRVLVPPVAHQPIPSTLDDILHVADLASLGHWALFALGKAMAATPWGQQDLAALLGKTWAGDWSEVSRAGAALDNLSTFAREAARGVDGDVDLVVDGWTGKAADAMQLYFHSFSGQLVEVEDALAQMGSAYQGMAYGVFEQAKAAGSAVEMVIDLAIVAGIAAAVDAFLAATPVSPGSTPASTLLLILDVGIMTAEIYKIIGYVGTAMSIIDASVGVLAEAGSTLAKFRRLELPKDPYDHKAV